ncbi:MAG: hypothetical protein AAF632_23150 [Bacteroidota bacterium]
MKITKELLERHGMGLCTEEEKKAIEEWFETLDDPSTNLTVTGTPEVDEVGIWSKMSQSYPELEDQMSVRKAKNIVLLNYVTRFAAAACVIIGAFFIGYFTALPSAQANPTKSSNRLTDLPGLLHIYGGDGGYGVVTENRYRIEFEGRLALYNESQYPKQIVCGEQEFTLEPQRKYYLSGSHQQASLVISEDWRMDTYGGGRPELVGDFSFLRLD